jgi:hypothetical protein
MTRGRLHPCRCCGARTIACLGHYEICSVCGWEDDPHQAENPDLRGGANKPSLNEARSAWRARHSTI